MKINFIVNFCNIDWEHYISIDHKFAVDSFVNSPHFNHSLYVALKTKDAIVDQFRDKCGMRPDVDLDHPNLRINVHITDETCTLSIDSSGKSLHKEAIGWKPMKRLFLRH